MARTNYSYEKRQKELARQKKQEEKRLRKLEKRNAAAEGGVDDSGDSGVGTIDETIDKAADDAAERAAGDASADD